MWEYGGMATEGLKELAELGDVAKLRSELEQQVYILKTNLSSKVLMIFYWFYSGANWWYKKYHQS